MNDSKRSVRIAPAIRVLAVLFLVCACAAACFVIARFLDEPTGYTLRGVGMFLLSAYLTVLFGWVAVTGHAPPTWLFPLGGSRSTAYPDRGGGPDADRR